MKSGARSHRLSEQLTAELDEIRKSHADLMHSQLESLRSDINSIASDARSTIESDIKSFETMLRRRLTREAMRAMPSRRRSILTATAIFLMAVTAFGMGVASTEWSRKSFLFSRHGIEEVSRPNGTFLLLPNRRAQLRTCTIAGASQPCIHIEEE
ncbi:hypothetical protein SAMN05444413_101500 [Roseivivax marinus]|nr:hypothetical protein SAMN05444413_101500 [Roseivivax marinus]